MVPKTSWKAKSGENFVKVRSPEGSHSTNRRRISVQSPIIQEGRNCKTLTRKISRAICSSACLFPHTEAKASAMPAEDCRSSATARTNEIARIDGSERKVHRATRRLSVVTRQAPRDCSRYERSLLFVAAGTSLMDARTTRWPDNARGVLDCWL